MLITAHLMMYESKILGIFNGFASRFLTRNRIFFHVALDQACCCVGPSLLLLQLDFSIGSHAEVILEPAMHTRTFFRSLLVVIACLFVYYLAEPTPFPSLTTFKANKSKT